MAAELSHWKACDLWWCVWQQLCWEKCLFSELHCWDWILALQMPGHDLRSGCTLSEMKSLCTFRHLIFLSRSLSSSWTNLMASSLSSFRSLSNKHLKWDNTLSQEFSALKFKMNLSNVLNRMISLSRILSCKTSGSRTLADCGGADPRGFLSNNLDTMATIKHFASLLNFEVFSSALAE